jgi:hypothetical protein
MRVSDRALALPTFVAEKATRPGDYPTSSNVPDGIEEVTHISEAPRR